MNILKSVIRHLDNSVEASWVRESVPAIEVPEHVAPDTLDKDGNVIAGVVTPAYTIPAEYEQVKCQSYAPSQMQMLRDDVAIYGGNIANHAGLIAAVEAAIAVPTAQELAAQFAQIKADKNFQINQWRAAANQTSFAHLGKQIACDALSRSDIDAVAGSIALTGVFPAGFPGAWKAVDNSYVMLPTPDEFKAMYASMTLAGTQNFGRSQALKTALAAATTVEQVSAIVWA